MGLLLYFKLTKYLETKTVGTTKIISAENLLLLVLFIITKK